jgi:2-keto-4-pentenoate hydratase/2-oxohepta-3-ene-1,7-dioic acid hydratase in catechol pathway
MKVCRFLHDGRARYGIAEGDEVALLTEAPFDHVERAGPVLSLKELTLLTPCAPSKIVGVGLNYRAHALEMKKALPSRPLLFLKPPTAALAPEQAILLPSESGEVHYESELAVVIGAAARRVTPAEARQCILGYTCFNDVTARDIQRAEVQYTRAKGFDTFAPFGPFIETEADPHKLLVKGRLNGAIRQLGSTSDMVFDVFELVSFASRGMTLLPGDVLTTGTPPGVGPLSPGDVFEVEIDGVGLLRNPVRRDEERSPGRT